MSIGLKRQWTRIARCFLKTEDGGVAIYVALVSAVMIGFGALVVDLGRLFTLQTELQNAADAAALAGAAELDGTSGARARAILAATTVLPIANRQTFASGGADITFDTNTDFSANTDIRFFSALSPSDDDVPLTDTVATSDANAYYIEVTAAARQLDYLLAPVLAARIGGDGQGPTSGQASAVAVAGFNSVVCKFPPLMICNPAEATNPGAGFVVVPGQLIQLKTKGGGGHWGPGNFGLLQPPSGNMGAKETTEELARSEPSGCFSATVDTRPGAVAPVSNGINVRFDMYDQPYFGGNAKNDSQYKPAPNVIKGKFYQNQTKICNYDDVGNSPCPD
ncbi:MAG: pilus assembly protein TadG-related protein, partial [Alphaproteobacteria bacterium]|nr:pilus assembly protein TadG-related protein [Alphaproteobacteria bacterium]